MRIFAIEFYLGYPLNIQPFYYGIDQRHSVIVILVKIRNIFSALYLNLFIS